MTSDDLHQPIDRDLSEPLYEFTGDLLTIKNFLIENGGVIDDDILAALDAAEGAFHEKALRVAGMIESLQVEAEGYDARAEIFMSRVRRIQQKARARANAADSLKRYLLTQMEVAGEKKISGPDFDVRVQKNSTPSIITKPIPEELPEEIAEEILKPPAPREIDTKEVVARWKQDPESMEELGFVIEIGHHLRIS